MIRKLFQLPLCVAMAMASGHTANALPQATAVEQTADTTIVSDADSVVIEAPSTDKEEVTMPTFVTIDGDKYVLKNGEAYKIKDPDYAESQHSLYSYHGDEDYDDDVDTLLSKRVVPILAIIFGVPCLAVVIIVWLIINYLLKRSRERNTIISKAIDAGYPLPDAFFVQPSARETLTGNINGDTMANDKRIFALQPMSLRDPRKFSSGIKLIGIGLPIFLFFAWSGHGSVAFLCGGLLIFLGAAQLISYYCVPNYQSGGYPQPGTGGNMRQPASMPYNSETHNHNGPMCPPPPPANRQ